MKPENKKILDDNYGLYRQMMATASFDNLINQGIFGRFDLSGLKVVLAEEFCPGFDTDLSDIRLAHNMIKDVYRHYDRWKHEMADELLS